MSTSSLSTASALAEVSELIASAERSRRLGFAARFAAIERLEVHALGRLELLASPESEPLQVRALETMGSLTELNRRVFLRWRRRIAARRWTRPGLLRAFTRLAERSPPSRSYDAVDAALSLLFSAELEVDLGPLPDPEMVRYQPTPARELLRLIRAGAIQPADHFLDVGSGLGHVVLLVALLAGADARGVEIDPDANVAALEAARALKLQSVTFLQADARQLPLDRYSVFFLYTPFRGALLREFLGLLEAQASARPIRVCTLGPCTAEVAREPWLRPATDEPLDPDRIAMFLSR